MCSHAEKRQSFNKRYKDVLEATNSYEGHVRWASNVEASAKKYAKRAQAHHQQQGKSGRQ